MSLDSVRIETTLDNLRSAVEDYVAKVATQRDLATFRADVREKERDAALARAKAAEEDYHALNDHFDAVRDRVMELLRAISSMDFDRTDLLDMASELESSLNLD